MRTMYFVRHGETVANEQNYFAGKMDVALTELGRHQAEQAGRYLKKHELVFDEVHTSTLSRAQETAQVILHQSSQEDIPMYYSAQLAERDFGEFTFGNKNLLRKTSGYHNYEEILHSPHQCPLTAESFQELYNRVEDYYYRVLLPRADSGKRILVVSHKYVIEMLAMILNKTPIEEYFDMRLPNARPMSEDEVCGYFKSESKWLKHISDLTLFSSSAMILAAVFLGGLGKLLFPYALPSVVFMGMIGTLLAVCAFFVMLMVNTSVLKQTFNLDYRVLLPWGVRIAAATVLWNFWPHEQTQPVWLLLMMPPALTSPIASLLWGGTLHLATRTTVFLSLLAPLYLSVVFQLSGNSRFTELLPFMVLTVAMLIPSILAQYIRVRYPIQAGRTAERWKWLGVVSVMLIALICGYRFTPGDLLVILQDGDDQLRLMMTQGGVLLVVFVIIKIISHVSKGLFTLADNEDVDVYVTHATPNIFLWISLVSGTLANGYVGFWAIIFFFTGMFLDECHFVQTFSHWFQNQHEQLLGQAGHGPLPSAAIPAGDDRLVPIAAEPVLQGIEDPAYYITT